MSAWLVARGNEEPQDQISPDFALKHAKNAPSAALSQQTGR